MGGLAACRSMVIGNGTALVGGTATSTVGSIFAVSGGARVGGTVFVDYRQLYSGSGGARVGGSVNSDDDNYNSGGFYLQSREYTGGIPQRFDQEGLCTGDHGLSSSWPTCDCLSLQEFDDIW
jgi:hypothetical protein